MGLPGDYSVIIPLVLDGLPGWAKIPGEQPSNLVDLEWKWCSPLFVKKGTELVCSSAGGGIFILLGVGHEDQQGH